MLKFRFALVPVVMALLSGTAMAAPTFPVASLTAASTAVSFESESAVNYQRVLTGEVLPESYTVQHYSFVFTNSDELQLLMSSFRDFKGFIGAKVLDLCLVQARSRKRCEAAAGNLLNAYVEVSEGDVASIVMASWLYRLDGDNWFDYDAARQATVPYLNEPNRKLYVIKGWRPDKVLVDKLTERDLPVVIDWNEKSLTIWTNQLDD
jgi:hypothetical protein